MLWVVNSDDRSIYKIDWRDGDVVARIQLSKEDPDATCGLKTEQVAT